MERTRKGQLPVHHDSQWGLFHLVQQIHMLRHSGWGKLCSDCWACFRHLNPCRLPDEHAASKNWEEIKPEHVALEISLRRNVQGGPNAFKLNQGISQIDLPTTFTDHFNKKPAEPKIPPGDLALLKLSSALTLRSRVRKPCLPEYYADDIGGMVYLTGYGMMGTNEKGQPVLPSDLQEVVVPLKDPDYCQDQSILGGYGFDKVHHICAGAIGRGATPGDSGGGLFANKDGRWWLIGVQSQFHTSDNNKDVSPDSYTRISDHCSWLWEKSNKEVVCIDRIIVQKQRTIACQRVFRTRLLRIKKALCGSAGPNGCTKQSSGSVYNGTRVFYINSTEDSSEETHETDDYYAGSMEEGEVVTTTCDPIQICCHSTTLRPMQNGVKCKEERSCLKASYCNGTSPECPAREPKHIGSLCQLQESHNARVGVCSGYGSECGSICRALGATFEECFPSGTADCRVYCRNRTIGENDCRPLPSITGGVFDVDMRLLRATYEDNAMAILYRPVNSTCGRKGKCEKSGDSVECVGSKSWIEDIFG